MSQLIKTLKDLAIDHPYYANQSNYFSNEAAGHYETWEDFYSEFGDADIDYNLCYRWDIKKQTDDNDEETGEFSMQITIIGQRKGIYLPNLIDVVTEKDVPQILEYLKKHYERMLENWEPLSSLLI